MKTLGDGFFVSFAKPESALQFCLVVQKKVKVARWPREIVDYAIHNASGRRQHSDYVQPRGLRIRMGIHFGMPFSCSLNQLTGRMDYYGRMVNIASRIQVEADGDEIAISDDFISELHRCRTGEMIPTDRLNHQIRAIVTLCRVLGRRFQSPVERSAAAQGGPQPGACIFNCPAQVAANTIQQRVK